MYTQASTVSRVFAVGALLTSALGPSRAAAQDQQLENRARSAARVIADLVSDPKLSPPNSLLRTAHCVSAIPGVKEAAFVVGGAVGYGMVSCRTSGGWSYPSYMGLKGASAGFQIGGQEQAVVLLFMNSDAPKTVANTNFQIGGKASVAAGPIGSSISAQSSVKESADIYSYSRKGAGLFAGIAMQGMNYEIDDKGNRTMYPSSFATSKDKSPSAAYLLSTTAGSDLPAALRVFVDMLNQRLGPGTLPKK
ncbi:MAG: lipid-binding SYLF domain-containing protein [Gemmatimonadota bacterium]|jgi:lipid-binding SYLF domain-containing protein|nr:lipid-binding SYLF domain-containing protein [Gemmatimonadota bacterium]